MDDLPLARKTRPALTTVRYDIYKIAYRAMQNLLNKIRGKEIKSEVLSVKLVIRDSCGAKKKGIFTRSSHA